MDRNSKNRTYLNQVDLITLNDFMRTVCTSLGKGDDRVATYKEAWSDKHVLDRVQATIPHLPLSHVRGLRQRMFGELLPGRHAGAGTMSARLVAAEADLAKLTSWAKACGWDGA